jgi:hypothetical protein
MNQVLRFDAAGKAVWVDKNSAHELPERAVDAPIKGCYALGCVAGQLDEMRAFAKLNNLNVDWKEDPHVPGFYDAEFPNQRELDKASKVFEQPNKSGGVSGRGITADELETATSRIVEKYGPARERA